MVCCWVKWVHPKADYWAGYWVAAMVKQRAASWDDNSADHAAVSSGLPMAAETVSLKGLSTVVETGCLMARSTVALMDVWWADTRDQRWAGEMDGSSVAESVGSMDNPLVAE